MSRNAKCVGLCPLITDGKKTLWRYFSLVDFFDHMLIPNYFASVSDRVNQGDFILVHSPSYDKAMRTPDGYFYLDHHRGGGLLRVETSRDGEIVVSPLSEGMRMFSEPLGRDMPVIEEECGPDPGGLAA